MKSIDYDISVIDKQSKGEKKFLFIIVTIIIIFALISTTGFYHLFWNPHDLHLEIETNIDFVMFKITFFKGLQFVGDTSGNYSMQIGDEYGNVLWRKDSTECDALYSVYNSIIYWSGMEPRPEHSQELIFRVWYWEGSAYIRYTQEQFTRSA